MGTTAIDEPSNLSRHSHTTNASQESHPIITSMAAKQLQKDVVLDLKLATARPAELLPAEEDENDDGDSKLELNLFNSSNTAAAAAESSSNNDGANKAAVDQVNKTFTCNFCKREFSTSQALGGHQNAHKQERALAKTRHTMAAAAGDIAAPPPYPGYSYYPYSAYPYYGALNRSPLGFRADAMIHKSYPYHPPWSSSSPPYGFRFGQGKTSSGYLTDPPASYERARIDNFQELGLEKYGGTLKLTVNSNPNSKEEGRTMKDDDDRKDQGLRFKDGEDDQADPTEEDGSGLDLNLRL